MQILVKYLLKNAPLKIASVILGCMLWHILSNFQCVEQTFQVPIYFSDHDKFTIYAPEYTHVTLSGIKRHINRLSALAVHIDSDSLKPGRHIIGVTNKDLFLPDTVHVVHYKPITLTIEKHA